MTLVQKILAECWTDYLNDKHPLDRLVAPICAEVYGYSTENIGFLLNQLLRTLAPTAGVYLEVGVYMGRTLLCAAHANEHIRCIGVEDFSGFDGEKTNRRTLLRNIINAKATNVELFLEDDRSAIHRLFTDESELPVDVYFYDGAHDYSGQFHGLEIMRHHMAARSVIIVDDANWIATRNATAEFLRHYPEYHEELTILTEDQHSSAWWNGIQILTKGL